MKQLLVTMLISILMIMSISSCSSDEEKDSFSPDLLSNTKMYVYKRESYLKDQIVEGYPFSPSYWYFEANGTCRGFQGGKWTMKGNSIIVTYQVSGLTEKSEYKIVKSEMEENRRNWEIVLRQEYEDDEFDYQLYYMRFESLIN